MKKKPNHPNDADVLRHRAEARLQKGRGAGTFTDTADTQRLVHELQVHQIELEMQNDELQADRNKMEVLLCKYTDLYDFAPTGYFTLNEQGIIQEVNLKGADLLGVDRSQLVKQRLQRFLEPKTRPVFLSFLENIFARPEGQSCEARILKPDSTLLWATFHGSPILSIDAPQKWCRVTVLDITALKEANEAKQRLEMMAAANQALQNEVDRRTAVEEALQTSKQETLLLLEESVDMQKQLRLLSRRVLTVQEEERKRISRELHDEITQTLVGIDVNLEMLSREAETKLENIKKKIAITKKLVENAVGIAHEFAQNLRPPMLDDLGLIPTLQFFMKNFMKDTGIRVSLKTFAAVEKLDTDQRTTLYRIVQEALTNVARHAHATHVQVSINKVPSGVQMEIKDNGTSFAAVEALHSKKRVPLGLIGMRERMEMIGGIFSIESEPGKGTTIIAQIPTTSGS